MRSNQLWSCLGCSIAGPTSIKPAGGRLARHDHVERRVGLEPGLQGPFGGGIRAIQQGVGLRLQHHHRVAGF